MQPCVDLGTRPVLRSLHEVEQDDGPEIGHWKRVDEMYGWSVAISGNPSRVINHFLLQSQSQIQPFDKEFDGEWPKAQCGRYNVLKPPLVSEGPYAH